jgi:signal transduction histidine kinase
MGSSAIHWLVLLCIFVVAAITISVGLFFILYRQRTGAIPAPAATNTDSVSSLEQSIMAERERIYADLHDDVGAKLLELIYRAETPQTAALARSALKDLRDVVSKTRGQPASLLESLSEMQLEAESRLGAAGIELNWIQDQSIPDKTLDSLQNLHLFRIVREAISNVIRHAGAQRLKIKLALIAGVLRIEVKDDGRGQISAEQGRGKSNMRQRTEELKGHITWRGATEGGTAVLLSIPLHTGSSE